MYMYYMHVMENSPALVNPKRNILYTKTGLGLSLPLGVSYHVAHKSMAMFDIEVNNTHTQPDTVRQAQHQGLQSILTILNLV